MSSAWRGPGSDTSLGTGVVQQRVAQLLRLHARRPRRTSVGQVKSGRSCAKPARHESASSSASASNQPRTSVPWRARQRSSAKRAWMSQSVSRCTTGWNWCRLNSTKE